MYQCTNCNSTMSTPKDRCPSCGVLLSGVKCQGCDYVGGKQEFIDNNHLCPKCGSAVEVSGGGDSGDCFVATAVYGDTQCAEVQALRRFRDAHLAQSRIGRRCIDFYYVHGPHWARAVRDRTMTKNCIRIMLNALVRMLGARAEPWKRNADEGK